ncbi:MAG: 16S rRNA (adenine(1518)-N(6)/adenine(1519)-N(6))-dimethyltransferase RsmA [Oscillospiraceae bacterium]|nr:16S rRNA (adenine(1518)-N(6)/adenine(1519)-N(6))-dimethyltransferase RsmA [Oscillospiraceae bacterium]
MDNLTNLSFMKSLCAKHGFVFEKKFGQNFIINPSVCPKIAEYAGVDENTCALEIGIGVGVLTTELAKRAKKVVAVEIDDSLKPLVAETLAEFDNVKIVWDDVLNVDLAKLIREEFVGERVVVCANLPYYITSPIITKLLSDNLPVENITVMVQKEAALRLCADEKSREIGAISMAVQYYSKPKICFNVSRGSFYPSPNVDSAVIRLDIRKDGKPTPKNEENMFRLIRGAFGQRRKTFVNSVNATLGIPKPDIEAALSQIGVDVRIRPEKLTLAQYAALSDILM